MDIIDNSIGMTSQSKILEVAPAKSVAKQFRRRFPLYEEAHYFPEAELGCMTRGYRNENLERLTFPDGSFDLVVTQDVFEHIARPGLAFQEVARVLRAGGVHVFTIPWFPGAATRARAYEDEGHIQYLSDPEYHGNPVDANGSLVFTEFGRDLPDIVLEVSGMKTSIFNAYRPGYGIVGDSLQVFCSYKDKSLGRGAVADLRDRNGAVGVFRQTSDR